MGNLIFSRKKTTREQLEKIQDEIDRIENYKISSFVQRKNCVAILYFLSFLTYVTGCGFIYLRFERSNKPLILISSAFLILFPVIKRKNFIKIQETETFNDAKSILEMYHPSALKNLSFSLSNLSTIDTPQKMVSTPIRPKLNSPERNSLPSNSFTNGSPKSIKSNPPNNLMNMPNLPKMSSQEATHGTFQRTIKPILPQNRSIVEKLIDYAFNDGPNNRYALICYKCFSHNGMALPEEFEYLSFVCAYCGSFNPSRKIRPPPPISFQRAIEGSEKSKDSNPNDSSSDKLKIVELSDSNKSTDEPLIKEPEDSEK
ncbi:Endoplasmic reticulum junction formation protein lunapark [Sarcoptes scabiei]|uniref:Endoplasmic reticulum junction formation protein lunapark n=2 Tax=Sarcoptes scabiei TaxID=52283 RepID=A0A834VG27_SARSC|nr:Endoplasmic reticulum junction formation protein lunapark [Sarcoptes scabiei]